MSTTFTAPHDMMALPSSEGVRPYIPLGWKYICTYASLAFSHMLDCCCLAATLVSTCTQKSHVQDFLGIKPD